MRYGLPYKGSKSRIVDELLTVIPPAEHFYDLFCGGCAVAHAAMLSGKWGTVHINDINPMMPEAFVKAISGGFNGEDRWISHEDFFRLRDTDPYASICFSFGNDLKSYCYARELEPYKKAMHYAVFFDDWSLFSELCPEICDRCKERVSPVADRTGRRIALANAINACAPGQGNPLYEAKQKHLEHLERLQSLEHLERLQSLERLERLQSLERLERLQVTSSDYRSIVFEPDSVIYCDIPYIGTNSYKAGFDHDAFYDWAEKQDHPVYISSYDMPKEHFKCIWEQTTNSILNADRPKRVVERLFVPRTHNYTQEHFLFDMEDF